MDFQDQIKSLSKRVESLYQQIQTEEATKTSLIMPFFSLLGYDVFNPLEFVPEYIADVGIKKGEKVDYAILNDEGNPVIIVEAKWCQDSLEHHSSQLFRYFSSTQARFAILTNGIEYQFYTDLDADNIMDTTPFYTFNILNIKDQDYADLRQFHKDSFDVEQVLSTAEDLKYTSAIKILLKKQLEAPSDDFSRYVLSTVYEGTKRQEIIEKFRPVIKRAFHQLINDLLSERLKGVIDVNPSEGIVSADNPEEDACEAEPVSSGPQIITTQEELDSYATVKAILHDVMAPSRISYVDRQSYFVIYCDGKCTQWICRLKLDGNKKWVAFPNGESIERYDITCVDDLFNLKDKLEESAKRY